jgi:hypothetical protein
MAFLSFILLAAMTYLIWRITDQLPDLIFRISEIQRDVAELRRTLAEESARPTAPQSLSTQRRGSESPTDAVL